jgi:hypothetical protein
MEKIRLNKKALRRVALCVLIDALMDLKEGKPKAENFFHYEQDWIEILCECADLEFKNFMVSVSQLTKTAFLL